ncbi:MAG: serine kinase [Gemmatimonadota bacterium]|nr:MAG: serine kinase [Gemmatimonadota bacterium]
MQLKEIFEKLDLEVKAGQDGLDHFVTGGYVSDLLSDVIANSRKCDLWITLQIHQNIVAVATLKELAGIILINGKEPADATISKAEAEGVPILVSPLTAYEIVSQLHDLGISGKR